MSSSLREGNRVCQHFLFIKKRIAFRVCNAPRSPFVHGRRLTKTRGPAAVISFGGACWGKARYSIYCPALQPSAHNCFSITIISINYTITREQTWGTPLSFANCAGYSLNGPLQDKDIRKRKWVPKGKFGLKLHRERKHQDTPHSLIDFAY